MTPTPSDDCANEILAAAYAEATAGTPESTIGIVPDGTYHPSLIGHLRKAARAKGYRMVIRHSDG
ncbi:MAG: hypothetical protein KGL39_29430, partial [Patescibacteria group bacterium]|nr:hypothetical protein [Patescibacteria group bacterium]